MILSETEKNRIRGLQRNASVIKGKLLNEGEIIENPNSIKNKLTGACFNTWKKSPGKKGVNSESDWGESWKIEGVEMAEDSRENNWGDKLTIKISKGGGCKNSVKTADRDDITATLTLVCDGQRDAKSYAFDFNATGTDKESFKSGPRFNQGISNIIKKKEWCKQAGVDRSPGKAEDEFASTGGQSNQQMSESYRKSSRRLQEKRILRKKERTIKLSKNGQVMRISESQFKRIAKSVLNKDKRQNILNEQERAVKLTKEKTTAGYKEVDKIKLPDGTYSKGGSGFGVKVKDSDGNDTGYYVVVNNGIRGPWSGQFKISGGKPELDVYKILFKKN